MQTAKRARVRFDFMFCLIVLLNLTACSVLSRYDEHSYQSLTSLKAQVKIFLKIALQTLHRVKKHSLIYRIFV